MDGIPFNREWNDELQQEAEIVMFHGHTALREHRMAHRKHATLGEFHESYGEHELLLKCPCCGSVDVESDSWGSYGGTTEGYTKCGFCGYTKSWADLSAVI